jgi:cation diffusion facilitator family transporter
VAVEKRSVALTSVAAAVFLTGFKIVVGLLTGSLGILAEALHSALDLVAAVVTYLAVRYSDRPPDERHPYGHGKVESLSALFETFLLLATCTWIIWEAVERLFFKDVHVEPSVWAFVVMGTSIVVDIGRSRALKRAALKHGSQALEADALHFSTDIWSSSVVILGLTLVALGRGTTMEPLLLKADAMAAMVVAFIVLGVSWRLIRAALDVLMDRSPEGLVAEVERLAYGVPGIVGCRRVRTRVVGNRTFVDRVLEVPRSTPLERSHELATHVEARIEAALPHTDVTLHVEPVAQEAEDWAQKVQGAAGRLGHYVHDVRVSSDGRRRVVHCHLEVDPGLSLRDAHAQADRFEEALLAEFPEVAEVNTHIESRDDGVLPDEEVLRDVPKVEAALRAILHELKVKGACHDVKVYRLGNRRIVALHCDLEGDQPVGEAHALSSRVGEALKKRFPEILRVQIHLEPK